MKLSFPFLCLLWLYPALLAQPQSIDGYFKELGRRRQHNGNILVAENGRPIVNFSSGYADFRTQTPNTPSSIFNLASLSKVLTATAILQLRDKGKFSLDDAVVQYLPDFPYKDVKIRHLLAHTSGLPDLELFETLVKHFPDTIVTNRDVLPELRNWKHGLYFKPGDEFRYCNTEYNLLALLVEKEGGMPFESYLRKYIFGPAGMKDTYIASAQCANQRGGRLIAQPQMKPHPGYDSTFVAADFISRFKYFTYNISGTIGQGNVMSTTTDMLKFDQAYFKGELLQASTMQEAMTPVKLNNGTVHYDHRMDTMDGEGKMAYGLGWEIFEQADFGKSVGHGGFKFGLATFYLHYLAKNQTIISFDNTAGSEFGRIITSAVLLLNNKPPMAFRTSRSLVTLYGMSLVKEGADHAAAVFNANKADTLAYYLNEGEMNDLGYDLYYMSNMPGHCELALEVFKLATFIFPGSFNTYDSYGQLLKESGKKEDAILMYKKSIELNPGNEDGKRILRQLLKSQDGE